VPWKNSLVLHYPIWSVAMPTMKAKTHSQAQKRRRNNSIVRTNGKGLNDTQLIKLLEAYQTIGEMLEKLVGRERLYRPQFRKGLESALQDVARGRTTEVKTFEDFAS
jgi:hypothetical protein